MVLISGLKDNPDLRPTQDVATLAYLDGDVKQLDTTWGIKPVCSRKILINAQGETVATKKTFKESFKERRCLVPCSGWYEWRDEGGPRKQRYSFTRVYGKPCLMAGIWYQAENAPELVTLTINPSPKCAEIHSRMPAMIDASDMDSWFYDSVEDAQRLLQPANDKDIQIE